MRLELTSRSDLAIRVLRTLDEHEGWLARNQLANLLGTTPDFLARVMMPLVANGWVSSRSGPGGGYALADTARPVSVLDLIEAVEGVPREGVCVLRDGACNPSQPCALHDAWTRARKALLEELRGAPVID